MKYTKEQTEKMINDYTTALKEGIDTIDAVTQLASELGKTVPEVRGKLVAEKVYVPQKKVTVVKEVVRKDALVKKIAAVTKLEGMESLEKANLPTLKALCKFLDEK